jgi:hypothetical protein
MLLHHESKSGGENGRGIRGGSALFGLVDQSLELFPRQGGNDRQRSLKALGRYDATPRELVIELDGDKYRRVGTPHEVGVEANQDRILAALSEVEAKTEEALVRETGLSRDRLRIGLGGLGVKVLREGKGVKGDPYTYRRAPSNSILSEALPIGPETNWDDPWANATPLPSSREATGVV